MGKRRKLSVNVYNKHRENIEPELKTLPSFKVDGFVCNRCGRGPFWTWEALKEHRDNYCKRRPKI